MGSKIKEKELQAGDWMGWAEFKRSVCICVYTHAAQGLFTECCEKENPQKDLDGNNDEQFI